MDICSEKMIENYLLYKNPLYAFRFPLALLFGIFLYGYMEMKKWSSNSYINQLLIPIAGILVMLVILDMISRMMVSKKDKKRLLLLCKMFLAKVMVKGAKKLSNLDLAMMEHYQGDIEGFENNTDSVSSEEPKDGEYQDKTEKKDELKEKQGEMQEKKQNAKVKVFDNIEKKEEDMKKPNKTEEDFMSIRPQIGAPMNYFENQQFVEFDNNALAYHVEPKPLVSKPVLNSKCIQNSDCCNLCSGMGDNPCNIIAPIPGPQWLPQTAAAKQNELKNNQYSSSLCPINK